MEYNFAQRGKVNSKCLAFYHRDFRGLLVVEFQDNNFLETKYWYIWDLQDFCRLIIFNVKN